MEPLRKEGVEEQLANSTVQAIMACVLGKSEKAQTAEKGKGGKGKNKEAASEAAKPAESLMTNQLTVLGRAEVDYLLKIARQVCQGEKDPKKAAQAVNDLIGKEGKKNLEAMRMAAGLDAALFGRMVTSDFLARGDAAVHVAHAFTVHTEETESDYFSAIDDLQREFAGETLGSAHINSVELTSGLYYGYVAIDVPLLISNLEGCKTADWEKADKTLASKVIENFVHLIATVSPGAKLGSTAPHGYASMVMIEKGDQQPRSLANAFLKPVAARPDLLVNTYSALSNHLHELDAMYGNGNERNLSAIGPTELLEQKKVLKAPLPLEKLAKWAADFNGGSI